MVLCSSKKHNVEDEDFAEVMVIVMVVVVAMMMVTMEMYVDP